MRLYCILQIYHFTRQTSKICLSLTHDLQNLFYSSRRLYQFPAISKLFEAAEQYNLLEIGITLKKKGIEHTIYITEMSYTY